MEVLIALTVCDMLLLKLDERLSKTLPVLLVGLLDTHVRHSVCFCSWQTRPCASGNSWKRLFVWRPRRRWRWTGQLHLLTL